MQLSLFDTPPAPALLRAVDPFGTVVRGKADETLTLPHPRLAWHLAEVELHRHEDGLWMWSVNTASGGYKVGPKWGKFAQTRDDALHYAKAELIEKTARMLERPDVFSVSPAQMRQVIAWAEGLQ